MVGCFMASLNSAHIISGVSTQLCSHFVDPAIHFLAAAELHFSLICIFTDCSRRMNIAH